MEIFPEVVAFDYCISLGYKCDIANALIDVCIRDASYPFDWCFTKISKINKCFETDFVDFFDRKNFVMESGYTGHPASDKDNGITYVHDGKFKDLMRNDEFYKKQKNKYDRRVKRLYENLNNDNNILFIHIPAENTTNDEIFKLVDTINNKNFKANIKFIILTTNNIPNDKIYENIKFIQLDSHYTIWTITNVLKNIKVVRHYRHRSSKISALKGGKKYEF
jgi:hypothetical protein